MTAEALASGYFGPGSITWHVSREAVLLLGARRAILMQLAHPLVAQGVADHSNFENDRFGRLFRTLSASTSVIFGTVEEADEVIERVKLVHESVKGELEEDAGAWKAGTPYRADQPDLLLWVHSTLVDTAVVFFQKFVSPLTSDQLQSYYAETLLPAGRLGIPLVTVPKTYEEFKSYMNAEISARRIFVSNTARKLAWPILYPKVKWFPDRIFDPLNIITIGTLPAQIREGYGLRWNLIREAMFGTAAFAVRRLLYVTPSPIRFIPQARLAFRRAFE